MINFLDKDNIDNSIDLERIFLTSTLDIQKNLNTQILVFIKNYISNIKISSDLNPSDDISLFLKKANNYLNKSTSNINLLTDLLNLLEELKNSCDNLNDSFENYNKKYKETIKKVYSNTDIIEKFIFQSTNMDYLEIENSSITTETTNTDTTINPQEDTNNNTCFNLIENTLIISEKNKKVILPYNISTVQDILQKNANRYSCIEDVIEKNYTRPLSCYKFSSISRFKEAFKLVKERENGSIIKAFNLAFELLGNYNLHPAIISACNSLDELDIYLACLDDNTLEDFHFFDIKFEIPVALSKFQTVSTLLSSKLSVSKT